MTDDEGLALKTQLPHRRHTERIGRLRRELGGHQATDVVGLDDVVEGVSHRLRLLRRGQALGGSAPPATPVALSTGSRAGDTGRRSGARGAARGARPPLQSRRTHK